MSHTDNYSFIWQETVEDQLAKAREEIGESAIVVTQAKVRFYGMGAFETEVQYIKKPETTDAVAGAILLKRVLVPISVLKRMGIIKQANASGKATTWMNTEDGLEWLGYFMIRRERIME